MAVERLLGRLLTAVGLVTQADLRAAEERIRLMIGRQESRHVRSTTCNRIRDAEFQVFSQGGEDGVIQYLLGKVKVGTTSFVEFGVQDYRESNTRFLLINDGWSGLIIDGGKAHQRFVHETGLAWRTGVKAMSAFVTRENINELLSRGGASGDLGLLSVDIDGNDYWVLESIEVVTPRLLIVEYNSTFGPDLAVTVPYAPAFQRTAAHSSNLYYGASLRALCSLATKKGYIFAGSNSAGNNAFFVREDVAASIPRARPEDEFVANRFLESRNTSGRLTLIESPLDRLHAIASLPLVRVGDGVTATVAELYGLAHT